MDRRHCGASPRHCGAILVRCECLRTQTSGSVFATAERSLITYYFEVLSCSCIMLLYSSEVPCGPPRGFNLRWVEPSTRYFLLLLNIAQTCFSWVSRSKSYVRFSRRQMAVQVCPYPAIARPFCHAITEYTAPAIKLSCTLHLCHHRTCVFIMHCTFIMH